MTDRRYDEDEVREIFDAASKAVERRQSEAAPDGLSLEDLKRIGGEVGLAPARIAEAARALDYTPSGVRVDRDFGLPVGVGRTVDLPREPTDQEWERIVSLLRRTFKAKGKLDPTMKYWWNGNLTVGVEPTADGYQLRLGTTKSDGRLLTRIGAGAILLAAGSWAVTALLGLPPEMGLISPIAGGYGAISIGANAVRLAPWARRRSEQMELVARRTVDMLLDAPPDDQD